jgi:predicted amidophosphoribosyltransferase
MNINLLDYLLPKNKYGSSPHSYVDKQSVANVVIKNKKFNDYNCSYLFRYQDEAITDLFESIKLNGNYDIITDLYNILKQELLTKLIYNVDNSIIVIIPSDPTRFVTRGFGFNEKIMELLISDGYNCVSPLIKTQSSINNSKLNREQRISKTNLYQVYDQAIVDKLSTFDNIIMFDDVITTGTTFEHCIKLLTIENKNLRCVAIAGE